MRSLVRAVFASSALCFALATAQSCSNTKKVDYPAPEAADGWSYRLVADGFRRPRGIVFDKDGGLIVVDSGRGLVHLKLKDDGGTCISVDKQTTLVKAPGLNHGIALSSDGKTIYASNIDSVFSWEYDASKVLVSDSNRTLVTGMSNSGHTSRTLLLPESKPGLLLVSRGSDGNRDEGTRRTNSGRSQIRMFNISDLAEDDDPYDYLKGGILGWGLRNSVGVAEHPRDGGIWSVENSADELKRKGEDIHKDNPAEEMNFHGYLNGSDEEGANYGYPGCFSIWSTEDFPDRGDMTTGDQFSIGDEDGDSDKKCRDDFVAPRLSFQAHMAPLDIKFNKDGSEAYVTFHGSWNRDEPVGYKISSIAFKDGQPTAKSDSMSATKDILKTKDLSECPDRCFRPVGMAWDSKDRLFFSSDATGEIFVLQRSDNGGGGSGGNGDDSNGSAGGEDDGGDSEDGVLGLMQVAPRSAGWAVTFAAVVVGLLLT